MIKKINKRKGAGNKLMLYGCTLMFVSLFFTCFINFESAKNKKIATELEKKFEREILLNDEDVLHKKKNLAKEDFDLEKKIDNDIFIYDLDDSVVGVLRIDKINIVLPIFKDINKKNLSKGVGILETTDQITLEKNKITVLAGHRGGKNNTSLFFNIDKLEINDEIKITTRENIFYYKVTGQEIIKSNDWSKFIREETKTKLFLMSCHPYPKNYQRLLIKAELKS